MSFASLRTICAASVFFGVALTLLPEGRERRIASLCATAALVLMFCSLLRGMDWESYALSLAEAREAAAAISSDAQTESQRLNRLVIEKECEEYIMDKAGDCACPLQGVTVSVTWSREGLWVPDSATLRLGSDQTGRERLSALIEAQLGIPLQRQEWIIEGSTQ